MDVKPVLAAIDKNFTASLERLKTLLRIPSVSADPAHDGDCEKAARATCAILKEMGFAADLYDTPAHFPIFFSMVITMCSPRPPWTFGKRPRLSLPCAGILMVLSAFTPVVPVTTRASS